MSNEYSRLAFVSGHAALLWYSAVFTSVSSIYQPLGSATTKPLYDHSFLVVKVFRGLLPRTRAIRCNLCAAFIKSFSLETDTQSHQEAKISDFLLFPPVEGRGYGHGLIPELLQISISFLNEVFVYFATESVNVCYKRKHKCPLENLSYLKSLSV